MSLIIGMTQNNYVLDYPTCSAAEQLIKVADKYPKLTAYSFLGFKTSFAKLKREIIRFATDLTRLGLARGDRIMLCLPNIPQALISFYGANLIGVNSVFVHPLSSEGELSYFIDDSKPKLIITMKWTKN